MVHRVLIALFLVLILVPVTRVDAAPPYEPPVDYVVQPGDTLTEIAKHSGTTVDALMQANSLRRADTVYSGQRLKLASQPVVTTGATKPETYTVRRGDTLSGLALRQGIAIAALAKANGLTSNALIYTGQKLVIPGATRSAQASPPTQTPKTTAPASSTALDHNEAHQAMADEGLSAPPPGSLPLPTDGPTIANAPLSGRWIEVDLGKQRVTAWEGSKAVYTTLASTGLRATPTVVGTFKIYVKLPIQNMSGPGYYVPNVPHVMYFYSGYGLHGAYWHNKFGQPMSHGCVNLPLPAAKWLYSWASVGTTVIVHR
jgi:LysM repeat protein